MASNNSLRGGTVLNSGDTKYKIVGVLGQGGFGITYLVMGELKVGNVTTEAKFAIKEHFPSAFCIRENDNVTPKPDKLQEYERSKSDFIAEARKLHALGTKNDNIVKVNEVFETNGTAYYVMQYINGESLSSYVKAKGKLSYKETLALLAPVFDAVDYLHKSRINHLDIKPDNIMLHDGINGVVPVLIDFGLSVHFKKNGDKTSPKGVQGVSEGYSPLEQYAGIKEFIPATDIYALMATLLYCLTGEKPKSAAELKLPEIRDSLAKIVPHDSIDGICKALNKSYEDRTSSISLLKTDLGLSSSDGTITTVLDIDEEKKKRIRLLVISIAAVLVVISVIIFWLKRPSTSLPPDELMSDTTIVETIDSAAVEPVPDSVADTEPTVTAEPSSTPTIDSAVSESVTNNSNMGYVDGRDFVETAAGLDMKMVWVEGGEFMMGGTSEQGSDAFDDEKPVRRVKLDSYYIGECEVTQAQWEKVMGTSIHQQAGKAGYQVNGTGPDYPMYYVSWEEAQAFCSELSRMTGRTYILPTEAQWEYAARGGKNADGTKYSGSWSIDAVAWYGDNSGGSTHPVKGKRANGLGLYDMSGNVWEWCSDWYGDYNVNDTNNPTGPSSGSYRVLRGGGWNGDARICRVSNRGNNPPGNRYSIYGFRVVLIP